MYGVCGEGEGDGGSEETARERGGEECTRERWREGGMEVGRVGGREGVSGRVRIHFGSSGWSASILDLAPFLALSPLLYNQVCGRGY